MQNNGLCLWFTGLSAAGKSTLAAVLKEHFIKNGREVTLLDGDLVREHLSKGLGFSAEDRETNLLRIAFVAGEIVKHGGIVIVAAITPYESARRKVRAYFDPKRFRLVWVNTPLNVCEARDPKGLYERAREGKIKNFTGIDDPFETPKNADIVLTTEHQTPQENLRELITEIETLNLY